MMISAAYDEHSCVSDHLELQEIGSLLPEALSRKVAKRIATPLIQSKITIPSICSVIERPRITELLERGAERCVANMISGRSRTGKTAAAVNLASKYKKVAWFSVDSSDTGWPVFAAYLQTSVLRAAFGDRSRQRANVASCSSTEEGISEFLTKLFGKATPKKDSEPMLIVLDNLHHVFDADWFAIFFDLLLHSLDPAINLLLLCRGKPPLPLWRLRSKQLLNVIDEKVLSFDLGETKSLYERLGLPSITAKAAFTISFGRAGKIADLAAERNQIGLSQNGRTMT